METKLSALVVDDEDKACELLEDLLNATGKFYKIRKSSSGSAAKKEIDRFTPDIVFLDIMMPEGDGFSLLRDFRDRRMASEIVFVTAHEHHAIEAFRHHAFGYLLKPLDRNELHECVDRFIRHRQKDDVVERLSMLLNKIDRIEKVRFNTRNGSNYIDPCDILFCKAEGNYTRIDLGDQHHLCSIQLGVVIDMLPKNMFARLGRSMAINCARLTKVDRRANQITLERKDKFYIVSLTQKQLSELENKS